MWNIAQIGKAIVCHVSVAMVNIMFRPFSSHVQPREPMRFVGVIVDVHKDSAVISHVSGNASSAHTSCGAQACKNSGIRIVVQQLAQAFGSKIAVNHDAYLSNRLQSDRGRMTFEASAAPLVA
jgi:hypothetical protein